jgi:hypothetical protein
MKPEPDRRVTARDGPLVGGNEQRVGEVREGQPVDKGVKVGPGRLESRSL